MTEQAPGGSLEGLEELWSAIGKILGSVLIVISSTVIHGLVLRQLWAWFVVAALALPGLTLVQAIGIRLVASVFLLGVKAREVPVADDAGAILLKSFGICIRDAAMFLVLGWIVQLFM